MAGEESFATGGTNRKAMHYVLKVDIGGIKGVVAPLVGKQPPDSHVWILGGDAPAFVKSEQPLYNGGPLANRTYQSGLGEAVKQIARRSIR